MAKCKNCNHLTVEIEKCLGVEVPFNYCPKTLDNPDIEINRICNYYDPITNADFIRAMSDEELAKILFAECTEGMHLAEGCPNCINDVPCQQCVLKWLKSESEEK